MIKMIIIFLFLLASAWLGWEMHQESGSVIITFRDRQIETSLWIALWLVVIAFILLYIILRLIIRGSHFPRQWKTWRQAKQVNQANRSVTLAICEIIEEQWQAAERYSKEAVLVQPFLGYVGAAIAAHNSGANFHRENYLRQALEAAPDTEITLGILLAKLQIQSGQMEEATQTLEKLKSSIPNHPVVKRLLSIAT